MIDRIHPLPLSRQAKAVGISQGSLYYLSHPVSAQDLVLMCRIDELHLELPFAGSGQTWRHNQAALVHRRRSVPAVKTP